MEKKIITLLLIILFLYPIPLFSKPSEEEAAQAISVSFQAFIISTFPAALSPDNNIIYFHRENVSGVFRLFTGRKTTE